ncbi:MAG TPA: class I SAM-dependent methyltransferase [Acidisarcina sp.]|nr:class I SAM-dependent methyltransferase [Acidisarcina sp.]
MAELNTSPRFHTFRDPAGSVEIRHDGAYRSIYAPHGTEMIAFLRTPLATALVAQGKLVASDIVASSPGVQGMMLRHPLISFRTYPWEWPPKLWLAAAELTLSLCGDLIREGWILQDATPLNILFRGMQPVFVDVLSIRRAEPHQPIWLAYGQFVRTFLLPMLAYQRLGWPLNATLLRRDGYEPEEIYSALPWHMRLRQPALSAVTLPMLLAGRTSIGTANLAAPSMKDADIAKQVILKTLDRLLSGMRKVTPSCHASTWSDYAQTATHYSAEDHAGKRDFVVRTLAASKPERVLDVGSNTGIYSALAADAGAEVVAIDTDLQTVDQLCTNLGSSGKNILPLCVDLSHPTPAAGWENRESASFLDRCDGHFNMVMMLAVLHHLLLRSQVPLEQIAALCSNITTRDLIVEWVPPSDAKFQELLRGRGALYAHITEATFRAAFAKYFTVVAETKLANNRILIHFQRR